MNKCWDVLASLCERGGQGNVPYTISVCLDTDSTMPISPSSINKLVPPDEKNGRLMPVFGIVFVTTAMFRIACSVTCTTNPTTSSAPNLRTVASRCSVSAGTIYNYYESKADLLGDTIESIWREIFFHSEDEQVFFKDVAACISWIYKRLEYGNEQFPGFFSLHSFGFVKDEKTDGKKKMLQTWGHILNELCNI